MVNFRLIMYRTAHGPRAGFVVDEKVFDAAGLTGKTSYATSLGVLEDWKNTQAILDASFTRTRNETITSAPLDQVTLLAPVLYPSAIFCAGANYIDHMLEMAAVQKIEPDPDPHGPGRNPWHFIKASRSVVATQSTISLPVHSKKVDWEAELAAVIGRPAKDVPLDEALEYVAGYTVASDLSARDLSARPHLAATSPFRYDWVSHKSFDGACPVGPWIVPAAEIPNPQNLAIKLWVNDVPKQDSHTSKMIFSVAEQIAYLSARITLHPGDLILTGTPAGVGHAKQEFLKSGDVVRVWIEGVGTLTNTLT